MRTWEQELTAVLSARHPYHLLTAEQLVGTCLYIFIKQELVEAVMDCEVCVVKTGMSGKAGNKGSIAVYVQIKAAKYCFVCSHFAAHQDKVIERNADYIEACKKIEFTSRYGPLSMEDMDYVFWCGDFNYRIDMAREQVSSYLVMICVCCCCCCVGTFSHSEQQPDRTPEGRPAPHPGLRRLCLPRLL